MIDLKNDQSANVSIWQMYAIDFIDRHPRVEAKSCKGWLVLSIRNEKSPFHWGTSLLFVKTHYSMKD